MKNKSEIAAKLRVSKRFVESEGVSEESEKIEQIQSLLSQAINNTECDDKESLVSTLAEIDQHAINGWDLTSATKELL